MDLSNKSVFIVDDNEELCDALRWLFESVHLHVETYTNALDFLKHYDSSQRGCLITDVRMPNMSGLELLEILKLQDSLLPVVIITGYGDIPMALRAMKAGAVDFILKPANEQCLLELTQKCLTHPYTTDPANEIKQRIKRLTEREHSVIELILEGKINREIANELAISLSTVEAHRAKIMQKMGAKNLPQMIKMYLQGQLKEELMNNHTAFYSN